MSAFLILKNSVVKPAAVLLVLLLGVVISLFGKMGGGQDKEVSMTLRDYLVNSFVSELPEINKKLPHKIDNNTTLLSIKYLNGKVVSLYQLDGIDGDAKSIGNFVKKIKPILIRKICLDEVKGKLLEVDVEFLEKYQSPKGVAIFEVGINRSDCLTLDLKK